MLIPLSISVYIDTISYSWLKEMKGEALLAGDSTLNCLHTSNSLLPHRTTGAGGESMTMAISKSHVTLMLFYLQNHVMSLLQ